MRNKALNFAIFVLFFPLHSRTKSSDAAEKAQEKLDKEKKKVSKQRRIKTSSSRIFNDEEMEMTVRELARLDKEKSEEIGSKKRVRRLKKESCSLSLGDDSLFAEQPLVKGHR